MLKGETRFKDLREDNDLKHKDIAEILGVSPNIYTQWEIGRNDIPLIKANELANYYKVSIDYLLGRSNINVISERNNIDFHLLCKRLKYFRKEKNLTQTELGDKVGFHQKTYSNFETGINRPTTFKLMHLADFYDVSMDFLVGRSDVKEIKNRK